MNLTKEKIANFLTNTFNNDYFKFDLMCSEIEVIKFNQSDNLLWVDYQFWDDGHSHGVEENFLFSRDIRDEFDLYFPAHMELVRFQSEFKWSTIQDCLQLSANHSGEDVLDVENTYFEWGGPELDQFVELYFDQLDKNSLSDMLKIYSIDDVVPEFIPMSLRPIFQAVLSEK